MTKTSTPNPNKNKTSTILRLERLNSDILCLKENLKSYTCEPKTPGLFAQREEIRSALEGQRSSIQELIKIMQSPKQNLDEGTANIAGRLKQFRALERSVLEYIGMAKMHC